jgi:hypothetical protein
VLHAKRRRAAHNAGPAGLQARSVALLYSTSRAECCGADLNQNEPPSFACGQEETRKLAPLFEPLIALIHAFSRLNTPNNLLPALPTMNARTAVLFTALLLSACLANARESEWCAEQRAGCEKRCSGADKTQFKCDDTDGERARTAAAPTRHDAPATAHQLVSAPPCAACTSRTHLPSTQLTPPLRLYCRLSCRLVCLRLC